MSALDVLRVPIDPMSLADHFDFQQMEMVGVSLAVDAVARSRVAAAREVGGMGQGGVPAIRFLIQMLGQDRVSGAASSADLVAAFQGGEPTTEHGRQAENMTYIAEADLACSLAAQEALAKLGAHAVPALMEALRSPLANRRSGAARALGQMGQAAEPALPQLNQLAKADEAENVRKSAADAAKAIKPRKWFSF